MKKRLIVRSLILGRVIFIGISTSDLDQFFAGLKDFVSAFNKQDEWAPPKNRK